MDSSDQLIKIAGEYGMRYVASVSGDMLDPVLISGLGVEWARANCVLPVRIGGVPHLLMPAPGKIGLQEYICLLTGEDLKPALAGEDVIKSAIEKCYYSRNDSPDKFLEVLSAGDRPLKDEARSDDLLQTSMESPVTQLVNLILLEAVKHGASDVHLEPFESRLRVRYRIDGVLRERSSPPKHLSEALISRVKIMARLDIAEKRLPQDGTARVRVGEREIDIRVSTVPVAEGERVVMRLLDRNVSLLSLEELGMADGMRDKIKGLLLEPHGMIIVSGPTGSGKTTTLYAALSQLDSSRKNIMTIEDPVEYKLPNVGQIQVRPKIGLTFAGGLRHVLRQDPDVILVGETRDLETAEIAVRASLTGHLVFTTLHTNDAPGAVIRLVDIGMDGYLIASCLKAVLAQRLVRKLCPKCRMRVPENELSSDRLRGGVHDGMFWVQKDEGCGECTDGFRGRTGIFELMPVTDEIRVMIRKGSSDFDGIRPVAERNGMVNLVSDGAAKARAGMTTMAEVLSATK